jgi:crotonobetainyl-CoA:carnitine CoA-transferase CaiB-like acyl-CoA transferase
MCGYPDRAPVFPALGIGDVSTGVHALAAITSALLGRERTGRGQYIETSLLDCYFERALEEQRVPYAPALTVEQAMNHPHLRERRTVRTITDRFLAEFDIPGFPMRFSEYGELNLEAPTLGENNAQILRDYLDYSDERLGKLEAAGVLHNGSR